MTAEKTWSVEPSHFADLTGAAWARALHRVSRRRWSQWAKWSTQAWCLGRGEITGFPKERCSVASEETEFTVARDILAESNWLTCKVLLQVKAWNDAAHLREVYNEVCPCPPLLCCPGLETV